MEDPAFLRSIGTIIRLYIIFRNKKSNRNKNSLYTNIFCICPQVFIYFPFQKHEPYFSFRGRQVTKNQKPRTITLKHKKRVSSTSCKPLARNPETTTLIHENGEELRSFLLQHASLPAVPEPGMNDPYSNPADDLFRQMALEMDCDPPLEVQWYETFILRKGKQASGKR